MFNVFLDVKAIYHFMLGTVLFLWLTPMPHSLDGCGQVVSLLGNLQSYNNNTDNTHISPAFTFLQHCSSLSHRTTERLPLISVHFYELHRNVIPCTITCSVLFLNCSWMNLTSCSTDAPHRGSFSHTQKTLATSDLLCKEPTMILPQSILDTTWFRRSNMKW